MHCPGCAFVCSDLRDICPRCYRDLRPAKKELGLRIVDTVASYEALLTEVTASERAMSGGGIGIESLLNATTLSAQPKAQLEVEHAPIHSPPVAAPLTNSAVVSSSLPFADAPARPTPPERQKGLDVPDPLEEFPLESDPISGVTGAKSVTPEPIVAVLPLDTAPRTAEPANVPRLSAAPLLQAASSTTQEPPATPPLPSRIASSSAAVGNAPPLRDVDELFGDALKDLESTRPSASFELGSDAFRRTLPVEEIQLFFELSERAFIDPTYESRYVTDVFTSADRTVKAEVLTKELEEMEKRLRAPLPSLKELQRKSRLKSAAPGGAIESAALQQPTTQRAPASIVRQLSAWLIDTLVVVALSLAVGTFFALVKDATLQERITFIESLDLVDFLIISSIALPAFFLLTWIYPLLSTLAFGTTAGQRVVGMRLFSILGPAANRQQLLVRTASAPLSLLLGGPILKLVSGRSWAERWSRTVVVRHVEEG